MSQLLLWGFEADWALVERTPGSLPELAHGRGYVDTLTRLVAASESNRALLRRFVAQRVAPGWRCEDDLSEDDEVERLVAASNAMLDRIAAIALSDDHGIR